jgi:hypothetical protein
MILFIIIFLFNFVHYFIGINVCVEILERSDNWVGFIGGIIIIIVVVVVVVVVVGCDFYY